jgi:hypothetical protein
MKELQRYKPVMGSHYVSGCGPEGDYEPYVYMYPDPNGEYVKLVDVRKAEGFDNPDQEYWGS